jgi:hypothetical protein
MPIRLRDDAKACILCPEPDKAPKGEDDVIDAIQGRLATGDVSRHMGIYRAKRKVNGDALWFAYNARGELAGIELVPPHGSEAQAVERLALVIYGDDVERFYQPHLSLISASSPPQPSPPPSLPARVVRSLLCAGRGPSPHR